MPRTTETTRPPAAPTLKLSHNPDEFDALAELFLGGDPATPSEPAPLRPTPTVAQTPPAPPAELPAPQATLELLILGHLPVRASPWVSQYARLSAEKLGAPVALLRTHGADVSIDLFGLPAQTRPESAFGEFDQAIAAASTAARHWILQLDEVAEPEIAGDPRIAALTLVAGANEAAIVAAYRTLKSLAPNPDAETANESESDDSNARFRVAVMGAEGQAATDAAAKLQQAARVFLSRPVGFAGAIARIGPTGAAGFYRGPAPASGTGLIDALVSGLASRSSPRPTPGAVDSVEPASALAIESPPSAPRQSPPAAPIGRLSARLATSSLRALAARCPDDPAAELAVDAAGQVHVLRDIDGSDSYQRLIGTLAWAMRHRELLALTAGDGSKIDLTSAVIGHLFTTEPKALVHVSHAEVKLHLFAPANIGPPGGWCCVDLN